MPPKSKRQSHSQKAQAARKAQASSKIAKTAQPNMQQGTARTPADAQSEWRLRITLSPLAASAQPAWELTLTRSPGSALSTLPHEPTPTRARCAPARPVLLFCCSRLGACAGTGKQRRTSSVAPSTPVNERNSSPARTPGLTPPTKKERAGTSPALPWRPMDLEQKDGTATVAAKRLVRSPCATPAPPKKKGRVVELTPGSPAEVANRDHDMPQQSKRQAQAQAAKKTHLASQNAKQAQQNLRECAAEAAQGPVAERAAEHADRDHDGRLHCGFPPSIHFSLKEKKRHRTPAAKRFQTAASVETVEMAGGITAFGASLHLEDPTLRIATVIASNSGWPGGACRDITGDVNRHEIHDRHHWQEEEEDMVSNWLLTASESWAMRSHHFARISGSFGLRSPEGTDTATIQGIDYTTSGVMGARMYADAWCCQGARLSASYAWCYTAATHIAGARFDTTRTYPTTLVFCAGPNVQQPEQRYGPTSDWAYRTYSERAHRNRSFFEAGAAWAVYAALHASAACDCDAVLLPLTLPVVSSGVFACPWYCNLAQHRRRFAATVERMLQTGELPDGATCAPLGKYFRKVVLVAAEPYDLLPLFFS